MRTRFVSVPEEAKSILVMHALILREKNDRVSRVIMPKWQIARRQKGQFHFSAGILKVREAG